jgi:tight adherence protein C
VRTTLWLVVASLAMVLALWLVVSGWRQPRPALGDALAHVRRAREPERPVLGASTGGGFARCGRAVNDGRVRRWTAGWTQPLHVIGRDVDVHVGMLVGACVAGLMLPTIMLGFAQAFGVFQIGWLAPAAVGFAGAVTAPILVHGEAMSRAESVRVDLRHQLGAFIDMLTMLLAGNAGYEGALDQAARAGDGLLFRQVRRRMREVSATGRSLIEALSLVADEYGIVELEQVAATARLSANEGAPVARSLAAKCATLRNTLAAEDEASARIRNDKVTPPMVGMALLFMALIIYPALNLN